MAKTALMTGASSGIGKQLVGLFAADGFNLVLVSRRGEVLRKLAEEVGRTYPIKIWSFALDITGEEASEQLYAKVKAKGIVVDVLVNNAGVGSFGPFADQSAKSIETLIQLNIVALTRLVHIFLPQMKERNRGHIFNVASTAAFQPGPLMAVYYATKSYVLHFSEALAAELASDGIAVSCLCPGTTKTEFSNNAGIVESTLFARTAMSSQQVARQGFKGFKANKVVIVPGFKNRLILFALRFLPRNLVCKISKALQQTRQPRL